mmetsp:Transcript_105898/g.269036  ORF Transcript_105898/g.269036 Transcript_105898/m.269036 type:complete len:251 (+) Transcript_105898:120-872(+)
MQPGELAAAAPRELRLHARAAVRERFGLGPPPRGLLPQLLLRCPQTEALRLRLLQPPAQRLRLLHEALMGGLELPALLLGTPEALVDATDLAAKLPLRVQALPQGIGLVGQPLLRDPQLPALQLRLPQALRQFAELLSAAAVVSRPAQAARAMPPQETLPKHGVLVPPLHASGEALPSGPLGATVQPPRQPCLEGRSSHGGLQHPSRAPCGNQRPRREHCPQPILLRFVTQTLYRAPRSRGPRQTRSMKP